MFLAGRSIERSAIGTDYGTFVPHICRSSHVSSGNTGDWIGMPFGVVSGVGLGMGVLDFGGDRRRGRGSLGMNLRHPIVTNEDFVA